MGCLYGKKDLLIDAENQGHYFFDDDDIAHKLNPAGPQHEMIASLAGIADYLDILAQHHLSNPPDDPRARAAAVFDMISRHEATLAHKLVEFLNTKRNVRLIGPKTGAADQRVATFSGSSVPKAPLAGGRLLYGSRGSVGVRVCISLPGACRSIL